MSGILLVLALLVWPVAGGEPVDGLNRLRNDPSAAASARLGELYDRIQDADQRFWIIHALGARLREQADPKALETLFEAAKEENPTLRGPALRALTGFTSLGRKGLPSPLLARLNAAAVQGAKHSHPSVRREADDLHRVLKEWSDPRGKRARPRERASVGLWIYLVRPLRWLWVLLIPGMVLIWTGFGLPVFDGDTAEGRRARAAWAVLRRQRLFMSVTAFLWLCLAAMLAGYGFDLMALLLGTPFYGIPGGWLKVYFAAGFCIFIPGALTAAGLASQPAGSLAVSSGRALPRSLILAAAIFAFLAPMELIYRLLLRSRPKDGAKEPGPPRPASLAWILDTGAVRTGLLAASVMSCEDVGLMPALDRGRELFGDRAKQRWGLGLASFDPRFALLCAAPVLAFICAVVAKGQPVQWSVSLPIVLLGCCLWSWCVLAGVLLAVSGTLEGVLAAGRYHEAVRGKLPEGFAPLSGSKDDREEEP